MTRGRADAALQYANDTQGDTNFDAKKLPPGRAIPNEWHLTGLMRASPKADPVRDASPGSAGAKGGGATSWRRRLAPHHRDVVRRFFGGQPAPSSPNTSSAKKTSPQNTSPKAKSK